eukprot:jgi/Tetstr1/445908/TSEL_033537.t1
MLTVEAEDNKWRELYRTKQCNYNMLAERFGITTTELADADEEAEREHEANEQLRENNSRLLALAMLVAASVSGDVEEEAEGQMERPMRALVAALRLVLAGIGRCVYIVKSLHVNGTLTSMTLYKPTTAFEGKEGESVMSLKNLRAVGFYLDDDGDMAVVLKALPNLVADPERLHVEGVTVNGMHINVRLVLGGDLKFLVALLGLASCSRTFAPARASVGRPRLPVARHARSCCRTPLCTIPAGRSASWGGPTRRRATPLAAAAAGEEATVGATGAELDAPVAVLHRAATDPSVPPMEVFKAMMALEKMKLPAAGFQEAITADGKRWRLVYTAGKDAVAAAIKAKGSHHELRQAGKYFPLTAVQSWDGAAGRIQNGVYLGHLASLRFSGPFYMHDKKLNFDFTKLTLKLGPWAPTFAVKSESESEAEFQRIAEAKGKGAQSPFFLFSYADDK